MYRGISMYTPSLCNSVTNAKGKRKKQKAKKSTTVIDIEEEEKEMKLFMGKYCYPSYLLFVLQLKLTTSLLETMFLYII